MTNQEQQTLKQAASEIRSLRTRNELQAARLGMFDQMMMLFNTYPSNPTQGYCHPDIAWECEKLAENATVTPDPDPATKKSTTAAYAEQQEVFPGSTNI